MEYTQTLKVPPIVCGMWSNTLTTFRHDFDSFSRLDVRPDSERIKILLNVVRRLFPDRNDK